MGNIGYVHRLGTAGGTYGKGHALTSPVRYPRPAVRVVLDMLQRVETRIGVSGFRVSGFRDLRVHETLKQNFTALNPKPPKQTPQHFSYESVVDPATALIGKPWPSQSLDGFWNRTLALTCQSLLYCDEVVVFPLS